MDRFKIKREILLEWTKSSDCAVFSEHQLDKIYSNIKDPIAEIKLKKYYPLEVLKDIDFTNNFFIGVDCATGLSQDYSTICVCDPKNRMEVVAQFKSNTIDTIELATVIYDLAKNYIRFGPIVIERNSVGKAVLDFLIKTDIVDRIYYEYRDVKAERRLTDGTVKKSKTKVKVYGVNTDKDSRDKMIELLVNTVSENYDIINSKYLADEIASLERGKNGKIEHSEMSHDDMVFAYLVCKYVWSYGSRLSEFGVFKTNSINADGTMSHVMSSREHDQDFARKFMSVARHNSDERSYNNSISAHQIINDYYEQQEYLRQKQEEDMKIHRNNIMTTLMNEFYNS